MGDGKWYFNWVVKNSDELKAYWFNYTGGCAWYQRVDSPGSVIYKNEEYGPNGRWRMKNDCATDKLWTNNVPGRVIDGTEKWWSMNRNSGNEDRADKLTVELVPD